MSKDKGELVDFFYSVADCGCVQTMSGMEGITHLTMEWTFSGKSYTINFAHEALVCSSVHVHFTCLANKISISRIIASTWRDANIQ